MFYFIDLNFGTISIGTQYIYRVVHKYVLRSDDHGSTTKWSYTSKCTLTDCHFVSGDIISHIDCKTYFAVFCNSLMMRSKWSTLLYCLTLCLFKQPWLQWICLIIENCP